MKVLIVENSTLVVEGLKSIFSAVTDVHVAGILPSTAPLCHKLASLSPDVLLLNPLLLDQQTAIATVRKLAQEIPVVAVCYQMIPKNLLDEFSDVIGIWDSTSSILETLRKVAATPEESDQGYELSDRECEVLRLVAKGLSSKEIADNLNISIHTVNTHRKNITRKTDIRSVAGLAVYAMLHNLN